MTLHQQNSKHDSIVLSITGKKAVQYVDVEGGYTRAERKIVTLENGERVFLKAATDTDTADWLRAEHKVYKNLSAPFLPKFIGFEDDQKNPVLILEDLSRSDWSVSWDKHRVKQVLDVLEKMSKIALPGGFKLPCLEEKRYEFASWKLVEKNPDQFLQLGLCSKTWLDRALPQLIEIDQKAPLSGNSLLHFDIRSDNICFTDDQIVLVDWNWACKGNSHFDLIAWLPSLMLEGGPSPDEIFPEAENGDFKLGALLAGFWAFQAGQPPPHPGSTVRKLQLNQLKVILPWALSGLNLPPLDFRTEI